MESPQYLGRDLLSKDESGWIFFGLKDGIGRFIKYVKYPFWCSEHTIPAQLTSGDKPPEEIILEVQQFVEGKVTYEERKTPSGKRTKIVKVSNVDVDESSVSPGSGNRVGEVIGSTSGAPVVENVTKPARRRGRPRKVPATGEPEQVVNVVVTAKKRKRKVTSK